VKVLNIHSKMERITVVHSTYCKYCPSNNHPQDEESKDIASMPDGIRQKYVFVCAWRTDKLCRGVCEELGYNEKKHSHLLNEESDDKLKEKE